MSHPKISSQNEPNLISTLDRVWASTRPNDLTETEFQQIWTDVQRTHDAPSTLAFRPKPTTRRAITLASFALAQIAAVLVVVFVLNQRDQSGTAPSVAQSSPSPALGNVKIDFDELVAVVELAGSSVDTVRLKSEETPALAYLDVPLNNPNDQLNHWESLSQ